MGFRGWSDNTVGIHFFSRQWKKRRCLSPIHRRHRGEQPQARKPVTAGDGRWVLLSITAPPSPTAQSSRRGRGGGWVCVVTHGTPTSPRADLRDSLASRLSQRQAASTKPDDTTTQPERRGEGVLAHSCVTQTQGLAAPPVSACAFTPSPAPAHAELGAAAATNNKPAHSTLLQIQDNLRWLRIAAPPPEAGVRMKHGESTERADTNQSRLGGSTSHDAQAGGGRIKEKALLAR